MRGPRRGISRYWALFCEMGTGKTKITIDTMGALYEAGRIDAALILAPKGVFDNWIMTEIPIHLPDRIPHQVMRWQPNITQSISRATARVCPAACEARQEVARVRHEHRSPVHAQRAPTPRLAFVKHNPDVPRRRRRKHVDQKQSGQAYEERRKSRPRRQVHAHPDRFAHHQKPDGPVLAVRFPGQSNASALPPTSPTKTDTLSCNSGPWDTNPSKRSSATGAWTS
jgi:hypothetical protein